MKRILTFFAIFVISSIFALTLFGEDLTYEVKKGDTLYSISRKYGLKVNDLLSINNLSSTNLKIGQKLLIKKDEQVYRDKKSNTVVNKVDSDLKKSNNNLQLYVVKKGDTLYSISRKTGVSVKDIIAINSLKNSKIFVSQKLKLSKSVISKKPTDNKNIDNKSNSNKKNSVKVSSKDNSVSNGKNKNIKSKKNNIIVTKNTSWPVSGVVTRYQDRLKGVMITCDKSQPVVSINSGKITYIAPYRKHGSLIIIKGNNNLDYVYGGFNSVSNSIGDRVVVGDKLGEILVDSSSKNASAYLFVYKNRSPINPVNAPRY